jgi:heme/copper-type cytochrome/quinol oxidase subunit 2
MQEVLAAVWLELKVWLIATPVIFVAAFLMAAFCAWAFKSKS